MLAVPEDVFHVLHSKSLMLEIQRFPICILHDAGYQYKRTPSCKFFIMSTEFDKNISD